MAMMLLQVYVKRSMGGGDFSDWKGNPDNYTYTVGGGTAATNHLASSKNIGMLKKPADWQEQAGPMESFYPTATTQKGPMPNYNNCSCDFATNCLADAAFTFPKSRKWDPTTA